jgi:hypothetical protein
MVPSVLRIAPFLAMVFAQIVLWLPVLSFECHYICTVYGRDCFFSLVLPFGAAAPLLIVHAAIYHLSLVADSERLLWDFLEYQC